MLGKPRWIHYAALFFGLICIGWSAIFTKMAGVTGFASGFYRMFIGAVAIIPVWFFWPNKKVTSIGLKAAALSGVFFACDIAMWNTSIMMSKAAISTLLANLSPVWVGFGVYFLYKEKPGKIYWIGTLLAIIGVVIIVGINSIVNSAVSLGSILALSASLFYASYMLTAQKVRGASDTITFTALSMAVSSVILFIFCLISGVQMTGYSSKSWLSLAGLGLISQFCGWIAINWSLGYIKPTAASVTLLFQSVVTAIIAVPVLHEVLDINEIVGAIIILTGIFLVNRMHWKSQNS